MLWVKKDIEGYEGVYSFEDAPTGLKGIVALHSTVRGPALGGCRMWDYTSEESALFDALRLSEGMTYKAAAAGLPLGGGKTVLFRSAKTADFWKSFASVLNRLEGRYITAEDVGTGEQDMDQIALHSSHVVGTSQSDGQGNPAIWTSLGVLWGIKAAVDRFVKRPLKDLKIGIQGCGSVGFLLAERLHREGVSHLYVTDINEKKVEVLEREFGAKKVHWDEMLNLDLDVFSPCALGGVLNKRTISKLQARVVAGAANNQLEILDKDDRLLVENGISYAPDFIINAGGLMAVAHKENLISGELDLCVKGIYSTLMKVWDLCEQNGITPQQAAELLGKTANRANS